MKLSTGARTPAPNTPPALPTLLLCITLLLSSQATFADYINGRRINTGGDIGELYQALGEPMAKGRSGQVCERFDGKKYCSSYRYIWKQGDRYLQVNVRSRMIVKMNWTRFRSALWK